jgi:hypothetical protein
MEQKYMSYHDAVEPICTGTAGAIELIIRPRAQDLGGLSVRRVLPARERRMVGPWIFFDHMGPAEFPPGAGIQVRPHPHIGLATVRTSSRERSCTATAWVSCNPSARARKT